MSVVFCALGSGSKGNSYLIGNGKNNILIDAGLSAKYICENLTDLGISPDQIDGIVITHEHMDHIAGIRVFSKNFGVPVYANEKTMSAILHKMPDMESKNVRVFENSFQIQSLDIQPFKTPHDSVCSCGFSIYSGINKVTVATDLGHMNSSVMENLKYSDILVLEANHDLEMLEKGPYSLFLKKRVRGPKGHLSNDLCGQTLTKLLDYGLKQVILAHLSDENNTPEIAYNTVIKYLNEKGAQDKKDIFIDIAQQQKRGKCYRIM